MKHLIDLISKVNTNPNGHAENSKYWLGYCAKHNLTPTQKGRGLVLLGFVKACVFVIW